MLLYKLQVIFGIMENGYKTFLRLGVKRKWNGKIYIVG